MTVLLVSPALHAQNKVDSMRLLLAQNLRDSLRGKTLVNLGIALERSQPQEAAQLFQEAIDLGRSGQEANWLTSAYVRLAGLYSAMGLRDSAEFHFNEARNYLAKHPNKKALSTYLTGWGIFNNTFGQYAEALVAYEQVAELGEAVIGKESMAGNYLNMSNVYARLNQAAKREEFIFKALTIFEEVKNETGLSFCYNSLGSIFYEQKAYTKAKEYYQKSLDIRIKRNDQRGIAAMYNNLANVAMDTDQFKEAL